MPDDAPAERFEPGKTYRCLTANSVFHCDHVGEQGIAFGVGTPRRGRSPDLVFHPVRDPGEWVEAPEIPHVSQAEHKASRPEWQAGGEYWIRPSPEPARASPAASRREPPARKAPVDDFAFPNIPAHLRPLFRQVTDAITAELREPRHRADRQETTLLNRVRHAFEGAGADG
jgi:hypothetical protein